MASIYLGMNRGQNPGIESSVTEGASTGSTDIEIRIDTGKGTLRSEAEIIIGALTRYLLDGRTAVFPE